MRPLIFNKSVLLILAVPALVAFVYLVQGSNSGDTFAVGEVDIMVGNESYYNGVSSPGTSWEISDLTIEKFFNFLDVKPNDYGEDTVVLSVELEDTYLCADVTLTSNDENGCNEPEGLVDNSCNDPGPGEGELANVIEFFWWADDGDNVYEDDENVISSGPVGNLTLGEAATLALADTDTNIWTEVGGPIAEGSTLAIGKAWCYGSIQPTALPQDGDDNAWSPADDNDNNGFSGEPLDGGFMCSGSTLDNVTQTDSLTLDVAFNAVQAFGNDGYLCSDGMPPEEPGEPEELFYESFGNGPNDNTFNEDEDDEHIWEESGTSGAEKSGPSGSEESSAPDGNRFGRMFGPDGRICIEINAVGYAGLELVYEWRGDDQAVLGDEGLTQIATAGSCAAPTGLTTVETHDMTFTDNPPWVTHSEDISAVDNSSFFLIFEADTAGSGVDFRIDGVYINGAPI